MALMPSRWVWDSLMASDTQAVAVILSYVPRPSSSQCCRRLHYRGPSFTGQQIFFHRSKMKWENHPGSTGFRVLPSLLSRPALVYVLLPLNSGAECPWPHPPLQWYVKHGKEDLLKGFGRLGVLQPSKSDTVCPGLPGMGRGSLPLSSITRITFPFLEHRGIELLQRIRTDKFSKASFPARRRQNVILMLDAVWHGTGV